MASNVFLWLFALVCIHCALAVPMNPNKPRIIIGYRRVHPNQAENYRQAGTLTDDPTSHNNQLGDGVYLSAEYGVWEGSPGDVDCIVTADAEAFEKVPKVVLPHEQLADMTDEDIVNDIKKLQLDPEKTIRISRIPHYSFDEPFQMLIPRALLNSRGGGLDIAAECEDARGPTVDYGQWTNTKGVALKRLSSTDKMNALADMLKMVKEFFENASTLPHVELLELRTTNAMYTAREGAGAFAEESKQCAGVSELKKSCRSIVKYYLNDRKEYAEFLVKAAQKSLDILSQSLSQTSDAAARTQAAKDLKQWAKRLQEQLDAKAKIVQAIKKGQPVNIRGYNPQSLSVEREALKGELTVLTKKLKTIAKKAADLEAKESPEDQQAANAGGKDKAIIPRLRDWLQKTWGTLFGSDKGQPDETGPNPEDNEVGSDDVPGGSGGGASGSAGNEEARLQAIRNSEWHDFVEEAASSGYGLNTVTEYFSQGLQYVQDNFPQLFEMIRRYPSAFNVLLHLSQDGVALATCIRKRPSRRAEDAESQDKCKHVQAMLAQGGTAKKGAALAPAQYVFYADFLWPQEAKKQNGFLPPTFTPTNTEYEVEGVDKIEIVDEASMILRTHLQLGPAAEAAARKASNATSGFHGIVYAVHATPNMLLSGKDCIAVGGIVWPQVMGWVQIPLDYKAPEKDPKQRANLKKHFENAFKEKNDLFQKNPDYDDARFKDMTTTSNVPGDFTPQALVEFMNKHGQAVGWVHNQAFPLFQAPVLISGDESKANKVAKKVEPPHALSFWQSVGHFFEAHIVALALLPFVVLANLIPGVGEAADALEIAALSTEAAEGIELAEVSGEGASELTPLLAKLKID